MNAHSYPDQRWVRAAPVVFVLIWSTGFIVARYAMPHAPPFSFLMWRFALSVACFVLWIRWAGVSWRASPQQWFHLCVVGALMQAGYLGGVWVAVKNGMSAGTTALIVGLQPILTALWLSRVADQARASARQWWGLVIGLAGVTMVVWRKLEVDEAGLGNLLWAIGALLAITAGTLYQKCWVQQGDVRVANAIQMGFAGLLILPMALAEPETLRWNVELLAAMAWSVLALSLGANSLLVLLIQRGAATAVTSLMYLVPPVTAGLAWLIFDENLTPLILLGMATCAAGVFLVLRSPSAKAS
jgi:drug/metabolite transporter (DMT)-like permease